MAGPRQPVARTKGLALAGGKRTVKLRSDDGSDELTATIAVEYNNYRPDRGEMWSLVPAQRGSMPTYGVVPVRVDLMTADARIGFAIERAELVAAQPARAAIEQVYGGPLTGSLGYADFAKIDPPLQSSSSVARLSGRRSAGTLTVRERELARTAGYSLGGAEAS